jgi:RNase H-fold protein (predicted Holliday junction resolvase)
MTLTHHNRILAISPSSRGFGFAVVEHGILVDWGTKPIKGKNKNTESVTKAKALITHYQPDVVVLENTTAKKSRRAPRIRSLSKRIIALVAKSKMRLYSREQVMKSFFPDGGGTKYALAELMAKTFPEELSDRLPPKRRAWMSEDGRIDIFEAVALAVMAINHHEISA